MRISFRSIKLLSSRSAGLALLLALGVFLTPQDGLTVRAQTPNCTESAPIQWAVADGGNGHWYQRFCTTTPVPGTAQWQPLQTAAEAQGRYLVTMTSEAEKDFVDALAVSCNCNYWVGGFQSANQATPSDGWQWVTGEPWSYTNWQLGSEPNDEDTGPIVEDNEENFLEMNSSAAWNDQNGNDGLADLTVGYILEWEDGSITIRKETDPPSNVLFDFELDGEGSANDESFSLSDGSSRQFTLPAGSYSVTEEELDGWTLDEIECSRGVTVDLADGEATINLIGGAQVTCTFVNVEGPVEEDDEDEDEDRRRVHLGPGFGGIISGDQAAENRARANAAGAAAVASNAPSTAESRPPSTGDAGLVSPSSR